MLISFLDVIKNKHLSLRQFLEKLITLHHHIQTILRIAWSRPLFHFLDGSFDVVPILAVPSKFSLVSSELQVQSAAFPKDNVPVGKKMVCEELLRRLETKAEEENLGMTRTKEKKGNHLELKISNVFIHAECSLLAYHIQHPGILPYRYFGGSKLSCHGCATFF